MYTILYSIYSVCAFNDVNSFMEHLQMLVIINVSKMYSSNKVILSLNCFIPAVYISYIKSIEPVTVVLSQFVSTTPDKITQFAFKSFCLSSFRLYRLLPL